MNFRYTYKDVQCKYCTQKENIGCVSGCIYILNNLPDLLEDRKFVEAIKNYKKCNNFQKYTLKKLNQNFSQN